MRPPVKRSLLIAAACAFAALPLLSVSATPRALVTGNDTTVVLVHGDYGHARDHTVRVARSRGGGWASTRSDDWAAGLRRFRSSFD